MVENTNQYLRKTEFNSGTFEASDRELLSENETILV